MPESPMTALISDTGAALLCARRLADVHFIPNLLQKSINNQYNTLITLNKI
jgi:hypothetical protein